MTALYCSAVMTVPAPGGGVLLQMNGEHVPKSAERADAKVAVAAGPEHVQVHIDRKSVV